MLLAIIAYHVPWRFRANEKVMRDTQAFRAFDDATDRNEHLGLIIGPWHW